MDRGLYLEISLVDIEQAVAEVPALPEALDNHIEEAVDLPIVVAQPWELRLICCCCFCLLGPSIRCWPSCMQTPTPKDVKARKNLYDAVIARPFPGCSQAPMHRKKLTSCPMYPASAYFSRCIVF